MNSTSVTWLWMLQICIFESTNLQIVQNLAELDMQVLLDWDDGRGGKRMASPSGLIVAAWPGADHLMRWNWFSFASLMHLYSNQLHKETPWVSFCSWNLLHLRSDVEFKVRMPLEWPWYIYTLVLPKKEFMHSKFILFIHIQFKFTWAPATWILLLSFL